MLTEILDTRLATTMREIHTMASGFEIDLHLTPYRIRKMIEGTRHRAFGYFLKDRLLGFLFVDDESPFPGRLIEHFVVLPWDQSNGVGSELLSFVMHDVFPGSVLFLGVDPKKQHLKDFYKKHGFERYDEGHMIFSGYVQKYIEWEEGDDPSNPSELGYP